MLVGRIGWQPGEPAPKPGESSMLRWTLMILGVLFFASLARWIFQLKRFLSPPSNSLLTTAKAHNEEIEPASLDAWVRSVAPEEAHATNHIEDDEG